MLAAEKAAFGSDHARWQAVGIALHLVVVLLFLALAWKMARQQRGPGDASGRLAPYGLAVFFALNLALVEMIVFTHINPYMLFVALELGAMLLAFDLLTRADLSPGGRAWRHAGAWLLLLAGAFAYEIGQFFALAVAAALAWDACRRAGPGRAVRLLLAYGSVLAIFQAADRIDRAIQPAGRAQVDYPNVLEGALSLGTARNAGRYVLFTLAQPFVPSGIRMGPNLGPDIRSRLVFSEPLEAWTAAGAFSPSLALSLLTVCLLLARAAWGCLAARGPTRGPLLLFLTLPASLFALHLAATVLGRLNPRPGSLGCNSYYAYLPLLMLLVGLAAALAVPCRSRWAARLDAGLFACLAALGAVMGAQVFGLNDRVKDQVRPFRVQNKLIAKLVRDHRQDRSFGLGMEHEAVGKFLRHGSRGLPFPMVLYPGVVNADEPTHVLFFEGGKLRALPVEEHRRLRGKPLFPPIRLVRLDRDAAVFACKGAILHSLDVDRVPAMPLVPCR